MIAPSVKKVLDFLALNNNSDRRTVSEKIKSVHHITTSKLTVHNRSAMVLRKQPPSNANFEKMKNPIL